MNGYNYNPAWVSVITLPGTQAFQTEALALFPGPSAIRPLTLSFSTLGFGSTWVLTPRPQQQQQQQNRG